MNESGLSISKWADETFGGTSTARAATRANEEMAELLSGLTGYKLDSEEVREECADIVICLARVCAYAGGDLFAEVDKKMATNRGRTWKTDGSGCAYHVKEGEE